MSETWGTFDGPWGFCRYCAFEIPVYEDGRLFYHERGRHYNASQMCNGSGQDPTPQPGPEATPLVCVSLVKSYAHLQARKKRVTEREEYLRTRARAAAPKKDVKLEVIVRGGD